MSVKVILYDYNGLNPGITIETGILKRFNRPYYCHYYYEFNRISVLLPIMFCYKGRVNW